MLYTLTSFRALPLNKIPPNKNIIRIDAIADSEQTDKENRGTKFRLRVRLENI